jgi:hypothetical protein
MDVKRKLRNNLIRQIQQLSTDKLNEMTRLLNKLEQHFKSKTKTLELAGSWKDLDNDLLAEFTDKLHENRTHDRQIN